MGVIEIRIGVDAGAGTMDSRGPEPREYQYDVALSFAGEDRRLVEAIARSLVDCDVRVFYDEFLATSYGAKTSSSTSLQYTGIRRSSVWSLCQTPIETRCGPNTSCAKPKSGHCLIRSSTLCQ
jgi:hypothetical protein